MFSRRERVERKDFASIQRSGKVFSGELVSVRLSRTDDEHNRYAVVVSGNVARSAVARNRAKRRIRHALKEVSRDTPRGTAVIVYAKKMALTATYRAFVEEIDSLFRHAARNHRKQ